MRKGRVTDDNGMDDLFDDDFINSQESSSGKGSSVASRLANLFVEDEGVGSGLKHEQKAPNTRNESTNPRLVYSASVSASVTTNATAIPRGTLGLAILRSSTGSQATDELMLYTANKKVELRQRLSGSFCVLMTRDQQAVFHDSSHNQWFISFLDLNSLILFIVTVVRCVDCHQTRSRTLSEIIPGDGHGSKVGDSVLFDVTLYTENPDGCIVEHKKEDGVKMKLTKKIMEKPSWKQVLIGLKQGSVTVFALMGVLGCISVRRIKITEDKSPAERETSPAISQPSENKPKDEVEKPTETSHEAKQDHVESGIQERMSRIGALPLPALSAITAHPNTDDKEHKDDLTNGIEKPGTDHNPEVDKKNVESEIISTPHPQPRQRITVQERIPPSGMSLEKFYETFLLELDRLHNRMEMSSGRILRTELETVKHEVHVLRNEFSENISLLNSKMDELNDAVARLNDQTEKKSTEENVQGPQSTPQSVLQCAMEHFAGEGTIEFADVRSILNDLIAEPHSSQQ